MKTYCIGSGDHFVMVEQVWGGGPTGDDLIVSVVRLGGAEHEFVGMCNKRWATLRSVLELVDDDIAHDRCNVRHHIGGGRYVRLAADGCSVDIRRWNLPADMCVGTDDWARDFDDKIQPTNCGVTLTLEEWAHLRTLVGVIDGAFPKLGAARPCYADDDHLGQLGWLRCPECNPYTFTLW